jgi:hypothetical protein
VKPIVFVAVQLLALAWASIAHVRRDPSRPYKLLWLAALCGVIGFDVWYFVDFAYPGGFAF